MTSKTAMFRAGRTLDPAEIAALMAAVGVLSAMPHQRRALTLLDSFDGRLFRAGLVLADDGSALALERIEDGAEIARQPGRPGTGFAGDLPPGPLRDRLAALLGVRRLLPWLALRTAVAAFEVRDKAGKLVLTLAQEHWSARAPDRRAGPVLAPVLRLTAMRGYGKALRRAAAALAREFAPHSPRQHLVEVCDAAGVAPGARSGSLDLRLTPDMTAGAAARAIHLALLDAMEAVEDGAARRVDPEFLHDFRVAVRRTRSALGQVDRGVLPEDVVAVARRDFQWLGEQTNRMRDLDVYLGDYPALEASLPVDRRADLAPFRDHLLGEARAEGRRVARLLRGPRYRALRDRWRAWLGTLPEASDGPAALMPVRDLADRGIWKVYRRLKREAAAIGRDSPPEALHALRITAKKLRYLLEFFRELYPAAKIDRLVRALKKLQDALGRFQDCTVQSARIADFAREMAEEGKAPAATQAALGMVADAMLARSAEARAACEKRIGRFTRPAVEARFRKLFRS